MTDVRMRESLSAMMDQEAGELEARRLLRDLDDETAASLGRWQLARDVLRGHQVALTGTDDFSARVRASLGKQDGARPAWVNPLTRVAVAASVAAATVTGWQAFSDGQFSGTTTTAQEMQTPDLLGPARDLAVRELGGVEARSVAVSPTRGEEDKEHLDDMILRHGEFTSRQGGQGVMSSARIVGADAAEESR